METSEEHAANLQRLEDHNKRGELEGQRNDITDHANALVISNHEQLEAAVAFFNDVVVAYEREVHRIHDPLVKAGDEIHKLALKTRKDLLEPAADAKQTFTKKITEYRAEERRKAEEVRVAQEKAEREAREKAEREQREAREKEEREAKELQDAIDAENARRQTEAEDAKLATAERLADEGDLDAADKVLDEEVVAPQLKMPPRPSPVIQQWNQPVEPVMDLPPMSSSPRKKVKGISERLIYVAEQTDPALMVRAMLAGKIPIGAFKISIDQGNVHKLVEAMKLADPSLAIDDIDWPGLAINGKLNVKTTKRRS